MGEIVGAALVAHVPTIMLPEEVRLEINDGKEITLVPGLRRLRSERDQGAVDQALDALSAAANGSGNLLALAIVRPGSLVPSNLYFTTSRAHVELAGVLDELPGCSVDFASPREPVLIGIGEVTTRPVAAETFDIARRRAEADRHSDLGPDDSGDGAR